MLPQAFLVADARYHCRGAARTGAQGGVEPGMTILSRSHRAKSRCPSGAHYLTVSRLRSTRTEIDMADVHPVIIVGGGPAGMVAGLQLARAGVPVTKIGRASCRERVCQYV